MNYIDIVNEFEKTGKYKSKRVCKCGKTFTAKSNQRRRCDECLKGDKNGYIKKTNRKKKTDR